jgi:hypothetical protein
MMNFLMLAAAAVFVRRAADRQLLGAVRRRLCSTSIVDDRPRPARLDLHAQPDRRHLRRPRCVTMHPGRAVLRHDRSRSPRCEGAGRVIGEVYPATHFMTIARGTFSKAPRLRRSLHGHRRFLALAARHPVLIALSIALLRKQAT